MASYVSTDFGVLEPETGGVQMPMAGVWRSWIGKLECATTESYVGLALCCRVCVMTYHHGLDRLDVLRKTN